MAKKADNDFPRERVIRNMMDLPYCKNIEQVFSNSFQDIDVAKRISAFRDQKFLYSIAPFYQAPKKKAQLKQLGIHRLVDHDGKLMLDSGGFSYFTAIRDGKEVSKKLTKEECIEIYNSAGLGDGDFCIALDIPPFANVGLTEELKIIEENNKIFKFMKENLDPSVSKKLIPVIHGWHPISIKKSLDGALGEKVVAIGGFFPYLMTGYYKELANKFRIILDYVFREMRSQFDGVRWHGLGANAQNSFHICSYSGIEQTDSAGWRLDATYLLVCFAELPMLYVGDRDRGQFKAIWRKGHEPALRECDCPTCAGLSYQERLYALKLSKDSLTEEGEPVPRGSGTIGFHNRCIHNIWHYMKEKEIAESLSERHGKYREYLTQRFKKNIRGTYFIKTIDEAEHTVDLFQFFKSKQ